jgi:GTP cyclohydrolase I
MDTRVLQWVSRFVRRFLQEIGEDPSREGLVETPRRVAKAVGDLFCGVSVTEDELVAQVKTFTEEALSDQIVVVRNIDFSSMCEHHLLPFYGVAHVAYIPNGNGVAPGLSKVGRVLDALAARPQVQERLTTQLFNVLNKALEPNALLVVLEATHHCMVSRGVKKVNSSTGTMKAGGLFKEDPTWLLVAKQMIHNS